MILHSRLLFRVPVYFLIITSLFSCTEQQQHEIPNLPDFDPSYYDYAISRMDEVIAEEPENAEAHYRRAELLLMQDKTNNALSSIRKAMELNEDDPVYHQLSAKAYLQKGQNREAINEAKDALLLGGKSVELYEILAQASLNSNYFSEALQYSDSALVLAPRNPYNYFFKGRALAAGGDTLAAESVLLRSMEMGAEEAEVYEALVDMYMHAANYGKARFYMEKNLNLQDANDRLLFQQAQILRRTGNQDSALVILSGIRNSGDLDRFAVNRELMELYFDRNIYDSALVYSSRMRESQPNDKRALLTRARIYDRRRNYQESLNTYQELLALDSLQQEDVHKIAAEELDNLKRKVAYLWRKQQEEELQKLKKGLAPLQPITPEEQQ